MAEVDADVWVLTESGIDVSPGADFTLVARSAPRRPGTDAEHWVMIWARLPARAARPTRDDEYAACASFPTPTGPMSVYGTVLPWCGAPWRGHPSAGAVAYAAALRAQSEDWRALATDGDLCVAGDFNQDLAERHYYWSAEARRHLREALRTSGLAAVTAAPTDPVSALTGGAMACIDHVCLSTKLAARAASPPTAWRSQVGGRRISDHPGVMITLADV
jgi:hypothetical protein